MKNYRAILFSLLLLPLVYLYPQNSWNPKNLPEQHGKHLDTTFSITINKNLPKYYLHYQEYYGPKEKSPDHNQTHFRVELKKSIIANPFQVIQSVSSAYYGNFIYQYGTWQLYAGEIVIDINFDGYNDLRFKTGEGGNEFVTNAFYECYLFNPKTNKFELCKDLLHVCNPTPFPDLNTLFGYSRMGFGATNFIVNEYKWNKNRLILLQEYQYKVADPECTLENPKEDSCEYIRWIYYYKKGTIVKTDSTIIYAKDIPKNHNLFW